MSHRKRIRKSLLLLLTAGVLLSLGIASVTAAVPAPKAPVGASGTHFIQAPPGECGPGLQTIHVGASIACTHGPDATSELLRITAESQVDAPAAYPNPPCARDSGGYVNTGKRIRVMYGYPSDTSYDATDAGRIANWLRIADYNLSQRGGSQHYRFYCNVNASGSPYVSIRIVKLLPIGSDGQFTYDDLLFSLYYQTNYGLGTTNYRNGKHDYAVFVDNIGNAYPYLGQGTRYADSRWDPALNYNNSTSYSKVALIKLTTSNGVDDPALTFMHETGHNLGAVQDDAPHASKAAHCYDEYDTMCYNDGGSYFFNGGTLTFPTACASPPYATQYFDCQRNDYYNAHPSSGTYIYSHWNLANSGWLTPRV